MRSHTPILARTLQHALFSLVGTVFQSYQYPCITSIYSSTMSADIRLTVWGLPLLGSLTSSLKAHIRINKSRARTYSHVAKYARSHLLGNSSASCLVATFISCLVTPSTKKAIGINCCLHLRQASRYLHFLCRSCCARDLCSCVPT